LISPAWRRLDLNRFDVGDGRRMMKHKPPEGMSEEDYDAIEAAVMETVRGRWFLAEFARRSHMDEMRQMLDAVARLEQVVTTNQMTPADPSIRLLVSRLKEVGAQLGRIVADMRAGSMDEAYCGAIEAQARALGGLLRLNGAPDLTKPRLPRSQPVLPAASEPSAPAAALNPPPPSVEMRDRAGDFEQRVAALAAIDQLSGLEKIRLFV
jgi:hypothetical protein